MRDNAQVTEARSGLLGETQVHDENAWMWASHRE
jgi:hypothetical protein